MKKLALISLTLISAAAISPVRAQKAIEAPIPCNLSLAESPALFGVKLDMPLADARKLFSRGLTDSSMKPRGPSAYVMSSFFVRSIGLPKTASGIPVSNLTFSGPANGNIDWLVLRFADKQTLTPEKLLERVVGFTHIAREVWWLVDDSDSPLVSWHAECRGFQIQFETEKNFYRIWLAKNDYVSPADRPAATR